MTAPSEAVPNSAEALDFETRASRDAHNKIVSWVQEQYTQIRNYRSYVERQWYLNLSFYFGKQNVAILKPQSTGIGISTRLYVPPAPYYRSRPVINRIRPTIRTELSQLTSQKPNASVVPSSAEDRDMYAAMAGEQIWDSFYREKKVSHTLRRSMWWTLVCGTGFIKSYWDGTKGDSAKGEDGDVCIIPETPFHVLVPDFREEELESQPFLIHAQEKPLEQLQMLFGDQARGLNKTNESQTIIEDSFLNLVGIHPLNKQSTVLVLEVWVKPGHLPMFPDGAFFTVVGDRILQGFQGWPYQHNKFPFIKFDHIPSGKFYASSVIEDLIPLQKEYNRTRGQIIEAKNRMAKPQLIAPRGSVDASKITSEPGLVIQYTPGLDPPQPLPLQGLPAYVMDELDRIKTDMEDISGQHEVTSGTTPPGVTAATAISFLQERDESKLTHTFDSLEEGIEKLAFLSLSYVHEFWNVERMVRVTGPDGAFDVMAFKGSDLRGNLDIRIEAGSALPVSKAAKQALIMDMMKMGFIEPRKGLEIMDMGGLNKLYEQIQVDQRQAQRENLRMSKVDQQTLMQYNQQNAMMAMENPEAFEGNDPPLIVPVNTWDNHQIHIEYHNNYRKGQSFESLSPETKALFEAHVQMHVMALGMETITQDPRQAAGLPPLPPEESESEQGSPGPEPMPQLASEGAPI